MVCLKPLCYRESGINNAQHSLASNRCSTGRVCARIEVRKSSVIYILITSAIVGLRVTSRWCVGSQKRKHCSPLGTPSSCKFFEKKFCCIDHQHTANMAALWRGCKPRIRLGKTRMWKELECLSESWFKSRLQNSSYFCVSKYTVRTNSLTKAENGERGWGETLGFFLPPHTPVERVRLTRALFPRVRLLPRSFLL